MTLQEIIDRWGEPVIREICAKDPSAATMAEAYSLFGRMAPEILATLNACGYRRPRAKNAPLSC